MSKFDLKTIKVVKQRQSVLKSKITTKLQRTVLQETRLSQRRFIQSKFVMKSLWRISTRQLSNSTETAREKLLRKIDVLTGSAPLTHQSFAGRKRFYKHVGVKQIDDNKVNTAQLIILLKLNPFLLVWSCIGRQESAYPCT